MSSTSTSTSTRGSILFILTSAGAYPSTGTPTGWYLPELAHPYNYLSQFYHIHIASPAGGKAPLDPSSVELFKDDQGCKDFLANQEAQKQVTNTIKLSDIHDLSSYVAVLYPGGHGPMFDLATDSTSISIAQRVYESGHVVGAVCHGTAALLHVKLSNGTNLIKGKKVTGFSNSEEDVIQKTKDMPFLLETAIGEQGGIYEKAAEDWGVKVLSDSRVVTGQNPASSSDFAKAVHQAIQTATHHN